MPKDSKGQQVKTFKHFVMRPDLKSEEIIGKVYFKDDGFNIYLPDHIAAISSALPAVDAAYEARGARLEYGGRVIAAKTIDAVMASYKAALKAYETLIKNQQREKVIRVNFQHNIRWIPEFHGKRRQAPHQIGKQISFAGSPTIHLRYDILWRVGNDLYELVNEGQEDEYLAYKSKGHKDENVIPWTADAEAFFAQTVSNIERLIMALITFFDDMPTNLQLALENGGQLKLPAPPAATEKE